jgi:hypothetical protein
MSVASITTHSKQDFEFHLHLTMGEAMVLSSLFAYGHEPLMKEALAKGGCINEGVTDPAKVMETLYRKLRQDLHGEVNRCMELRRVFHNPDQFTIIPKPKS